MPCHDPYIVQHKVMGPIPAPCGKCPHCKKCRIAHWAFRLRKEDEQSTSSLFCTLTYDTTCVPLTPNGMMSLDKRDVQLFFKRLRKASMPNALKIKYYAVGEYGTKTMRPHYHIILFNADKSLIGQSWNLGEVHIGDVSGASIAYTLKYVSKEGKIPQHKNDMRRPEFSLMSKGLGKPISMNR